MKLKLKNNRKNIIVISALILILIAGTICCFALRKDSKLSGTYITGPAGRADAYKLKLSGDRTVIMTVRTSL